MHRTQPASKKPSTNLLYPLLVKPLIFCVASLLWLLGLTALQGCSNYQPQQVSQQAANVEVTPGLQVDVLEDLVLSEDALNLYRHPLIERLESDETTLTVHLREAEALSFRAGHVVVGQSAQDVFLRRVEAVEVLGPRVYRLKTSGAQLEDFFAGGGLRVTGNPFEEDTPLDTHDTLLRTPGQVRSGVGSMLPFNGSMGALEAECGLDREAKLEIRPTFSLTPDFTLEANFAGGPEGRHVRAELGMSLSAVLAVEATGKLGFHCEASLQIKRLVRRQFFTLPTPAGPIPVMLVHRFTPTLHADLEITAEAEGLVSLGKNLRTSAGVAYRGGEWNALFTPPTVPEGIHPTTKVEASSSMGVSAAVGVHMAYQSLLYGIYGPYVEIDPRVEGTAEAEDMCTAEGRVDAVLDGVYGFAPKRDREDDQIEGCVDRAPDWNGRSKHVRGCRCSAEMNEEFEARFKRHEYQKVTTLNHRAEYDVMREWYLNGRCTRGRISLGRIPEFADKGRELRIPFLEVPEDDNGTPDDWRDDTSDWTAGVNEAWLQGVLDRRAPIFMATDPCDPNGRAYRDHRENRQTGRIEEYAPVLATEIETLLHNGYSIDRESCEAMKPPNFDLAGATVEFAFPELSYPLLETGKIPLREDCDEDDESGDGDGSGDGSGGNGNGNGGNGGGDDDGDGDDGDSDGNGGVIPDDNPIGDGAEDAVRAAYCILGNELCCAEGSELNADSSGCDCGGGTQANAAGNACVSCPTGAVPNPDPEGASTCVCDASAGFELVPGTNTCACDSQAGMKMNDAGTACVSAGCSSRFPVYDPALDKCRDREVCVEVHSTSSCVRYNSPWDSGSCLDGWGDGPNINRYSIGEWATLPSLVQQADSFFQSCGSGSCSWARDHCFISDSQSGWIRHTPAIWQGLRPDGSSDNFEHYEGETRASTGSAYAPGTLTGYRSKYIGYGGGTHYNYCGAGGGQPIVTTLEDTYWCRIAP